jgi:Sec-independent protein secretion pathway component TatC
VNRVTITAIISIVSVVMLCIGLGFLFIPPMVFEYLIWYSPDSETVMVSTLPTLNSALLVLGLAGLGVHGLLKNKLDLRPRHNISK